MSTLVPGCAAAIAGATSPSRIRRTRDVDRVDRAGADGDLLHIERRAGEEHRPALGDGHDGDRAGLAKRGEARTLERIDGDVDVGPVAVPDLLAVVKHRR